MELHLRADLLLYIKPLETEAKKASQRSSSPNQGFEVTGCNASKSVGKSG